MKSDSLISKNICELYESIAATSKKQRQIRSSIFWKKFNFKRRTKERIESVKKLLTDKGIEINLEDSLFGAEKRDQLIVFRLPSENFPQEQKIVSEKVENSAGFKLDDVKAQLSHLTNVESFHVGDAITFSMMFVEFFCNDRPSYELFPNVFGATRSNWTYHTAGVISQICKTLDLTCKFESLGKRDAVIETRSENPEIILVAEWEWDYKDIFGEGKELDKLKKSCQENRSADAFLLTYSPNSKYLQHLQKIAEYWISETKSAGEDAPSLFLHTVIFEEKVNYREFQMLNSVTIHQSEIHIWDGRYLHQ